MDNAPPEILDQVFRLACTDDGSTGRALSLVSARVRNISAPYKYYSAHVSGPNRIANFASFLEEYHAPIQYLKLDCTVPGMKLDECFSVQSAPAGMMMNIRENLHHRRRVENEKVDGVSANIDTIFRILAPQLKGLYLIPAMASLKLNRFTFTLLDTFFLYDYLYYVSIRWDPPFFPALKRLDISCDTSTEYGHTSAPARIRLPGLTHFGCCSHGKEGIWYLLYLYASLSKSGDMSELKHASAFDWFLTLDVLRVAVQGAKLPELLEIAEGMKRVEEFPSIIAREHDAALESVMHTKEWCYIVEGGEGFFDTSVVVY